VAINQKVGERRKAELVDNADADVTVGGSMSLLGFERNSRGFDMKLSEGR